MRYAVEEVECWQGSSSGVMRTFEVRSTASAAQVWVDEEGKTACTVCSGPLTAMKENCKHCQAVKRFLKQKHGPVA